MKSKFIDQNYVYVLNLETRSNNYYKEFNLTHGQLLTREYYLKEKIKSLYSINFLKKNKLWLLN